MNKILLTDLILGQIMSNPRAHNIAPDIKHIYEAHKPKYELCCGGKGKRLVQDINGYKKVEAVLKKMDEKSLGRLKLAIGLKVDDKLCTLDTDLDGKRKRIYL